MKSGHEWGVVFDQFFLYQNHGFHPLVEGDDDAPPSGVSATAAAAAATTATTATAAATAIAPALVYAPVDGLPVLRRGLPRQRRRSPGRIGDDDDDGGRRAVVVVVVVDDNASLCPDDILDVVRSR